MTPLAGVIARLEAVLALLTTGDCALEVEPCRTAVYLGGEVPWDACGDGGCATKDGMLWGQVLSIDPQTGTSEGGSCRTYNWTAQVGIVRCIATLGPDGSAPSPAAVQDDAERQAADADAIFSAMTCCATRPDWLRDVTVSSWNPVGPNGGCAGGTWTVRGSLDACC